jgi:hypothetical protein
MDVFEAIADFKADQNYDKLAQFFDAIRRDGDAAAPGMHLDSWQGQAALLAGRWVDAWRFRSYGQSAINFIRTISSHVGSPRLTAEDVAMLVPLGIRLTQFGRDNRAAVARVVEKLSDAMHETAGRNFVDDFCETFDTQLDELSDAETDDLIDTLVADLGSGAEIERLRTELYRTSPGGNAHRAGPMPRKLLSVSGTTRYDTITRTFDGKTKDLVPPTALGDTGLVLSMRLTVTGSETRRVPAPGFRDEDLTIVQPGASAFAHAVLNARARSLFREAENIVREDGGVPRIGEGWIGETVLFHILRKAFPDRRVLQHARPAWLAPQHLDVYFPDADIALEFQGAQHDRPVQFFGGEDAFARQQERDARKRVTCEVNGCRLIEVRSDYDAEELIERVRGMIRGGNRPVQMDLGGASPR